MTFISKTIRRFRAKINRHGIFLKKEGAMVEKDDTKLVSEKARDYFDQGFN